MLSLGGLGAFEKPVVLARVVGRRRRPLFGSLHFLQRCANEERAVAAVSNVGGIVRALSPADSKLMSSYNCSVYLQSHINGSLACS